MELPAVIADPDECVYTSCYCEENVWKLCEFVQKSCSEEELNKCYAVFISNDEKKIPLWYQKAREAEDMPVVWDYHVILVYKHKDGVQVFDLDSLLPFPSPFLDYLACCVGENKTLKPEFWRMFRVIPASEYLARFASDRTHMLKKSGAWISPPPDYPPIWTKECPNNIQELISMDPSQGFGQVCTLEEFISFFCPSS